MLYTFLFFNCLCIFVSSSSLLVFPYPCSTNMLLFVFVINITLTHVHLRFVLRKFWAAWAVVSPLSRAAVSQAFTFVAKAPPSIMRATYHCQFAVTYTFLTYLQISEMAVYKVLSLNRPVRCKYRAQVINTIFDQTYILKCEPK